MEEFNCLFIVDKLLCFGVNKKKCTVELYTDENEQKVTVYNLTEVESGNKFKQEISFKCKDTAMRLFETLEKEFTTTEEEQHIIELTSITGINQPMSIEVKKRDELLFNSHIVGLKTILEK